MIKRDRYLDKIKRNMWNGDIKVITGIRRCGKSVLLFDLFYDYLISQGIKEEEIIKIQLDQRKFYQFRNPITLCEYVESIVAKNSEKKFYLFIDEVQFTTKVKDEKNGGVEVTIYDMLNELKAYKNLDVYVTGSNSKMLSKDIATEFRGRATQIHVFPLSFSEFHSYHNNDEQKDLEEYMLYGGMPHIVQIQNEEDKKNYLKNLYDELYIKDIIERNGVQKEELLNEILNYLSSQIGSLTNPTNIANALSSKKKEKINNNLVSNYIKHMEDAFLINEADRYDVKGKTYLNSPKKYYFTDIGLRNSRLNYRQFDAGYIMENIIYNELLMRGYSVDVGVVTDRTGGLTQSREIDFVVNSTDKRVYIQSALQLTDSKKAEMEALPLSLTKDFFKKIIIRTDIPRTYYDDHGILHLKLLDFLLDRHELF